MIIVLLLFFQSICLYCQRLVLYIHDRWINPKNVRLLKEAAESSAARKLLLQQQSTAAGVSKTHGKSLRKRYTTVSSGEHGAAGILAETCRFCVNSPQGYCRHHFHLQELQVQKQQQQQRFWNPLGGATDKSQELRQLRKINRELRRNLKNRLYPKQQQQQQYQQQQQQQKPFECQSQYTQQSYHHYQSPQQYGSDISEQIGDGAQNSTATLNNNSSCSSGIYSWHDVHLPDGTLSDIATTTTTKTTTGPDSGLATPSTLETTYYFESDTTASECSTSHAAVAVAVAAKSELAAHSSITTTYL